MNILLISLLCCLVLALPSASAQKVKWCVKTQNELKKCKHLASKSTDLECYLQPSRTDCVKSIKEGKADAIIANGEQIYFAGLDPYNLRPIIKETYIAGDCFVVAAVKRDTDFSINDLRGKTSCHGHSTSTSGWGIPIGRLLQRNKIAWGGSDDMPLEKAVSQFFSSSCIPGISKTRYPNLCSACHGDCSRTQSEQYYNDVGAFQCLKNGNGQVSFVCHDAIPENEKQDYQLLCLDGSRKSVDEYKDCNFGDEPTRAVIARMDADSKRIYKALKQIPDSDLFSSDAFGGKDLIFIDTAKDLIELPNITDSFFYLKEDIYMVMQVLKDGNPRAASDRKIQWCTTSHAEQMKCDSLKISKMECKRASSVDDCIKKVMRREADAFVADGGQAYIAGKCGLVPAMVEQYNEQNCPNGREAFGYYVVAVVHKDSGITWNNLRGRKSCHTGLNENAGWKVPNAVICADKTDCTLYNFFSKGCAPGADPKSNMCELCIGSGGVAGNVTKCKASSGERYYGHDGAFRCLAEKAGEVAFIKHSIVGDYTGKGKDWAKDLSADDFELICPKSPDRRFKYSEFEACHLARVPAHAVITRKDVRNDVVALLKDAQISKPDLFKPVGDRNLLFTDSTKCLKEMTKPLEEFLTQPYIDRIEKSYTTGQGIPDLVKYCTSM